MSASFGNCVLSRFCSFRVFAFCLELVLRTLIRPSKSVAVKNTQNNPLRVPQISNVNTFVEDKCQQTTGSNISCFCFAVFEFFRLENSEIIFNFFEDCFDCQLDILVVELVFDFGEFSFADCNEYFGDVICFLGNKSRNRHDHRRRLQVRPELS